MDSNIIKASGPCQNLEDENPCLTTQCQKLHQQNKFFAIFSLDYDDYRYENTEQN
jgi:hypothetical protein